MGSIPTISTNRRNQQRLPQSHKQHALLAQRKSIGLRNRGSGVRISYRVLCRSLLVSMETRLAFGLRKLGFDSAIGRLATCSRSSAEERLPPEENVGGSNPSGNTNIGMWSGYGILVMCPTKSSATPVGRLNPPRNFRTDPSMARSTYDQHVASVRTRRDTQGENNPAQPTQTPSGVTRPKLQR